MPTFGARVDPNVRDDWIEHGLSGIVASGPSDAWRVRDGIPHRDQRSPECRHNDQVPRRNEEDGLTGEPWPGPANASTRSAATRAGSPPEIDSQAEWSSVGGCRDGTEAGSQYGRRRTRAGPRPAESARVSTFSRVPCNRSAPPRQALDRRSGGSGGRRSGYGGGLSGMAGDVLDGIPYRDDLLRVVLIHINAESVLDRQNHFDHTQRIGMEIGRQCGGRDHLLGFYMLQLLADDLLDPAIDLSHLVHVISWSGPRPAAGRERPGRARAGGRRKPRRCRRS